MALDVGPYVPCWFKEMSWQSYCIIYHILRVQSRMSISGKVSCGNVQFPSFVGYEKTIVILQSDSKVKIPLVGSDSQRRKMIPFETNY